MRTVLQKLLNANLARAIVEQGDDQVGGIVVAAANATVTITRLARTDADPAITHSVPISALPTEQELAARADTVPVPARLLAALPPGVFDGPA